MSTHGAQAIAIDDIPEKEKPPNRVAGVETLAVRHHGGAASRHDIGVLWRPQVGPFSAQTPFQAKGLVFEGKVSLRTPEVFVYKQNLYNLCHAH